MTLRHHERRFYAGEVRVRDGVLKLFGLCVLAGVLVAGMLFPVAGSLGVVSNRAGDGVGISNQRRDYVTV